MLFMAIERFRDGCAEAVYRRFRESGRGLPAGLDYVDSWVTTDLAVCYQIVSCEDPALLEIWTAHWSDLVDFEIIPVIESSAAAARVATGKSGAKRPPKAIG